MALICPSCGESNRDGAPFCGMCKAVLNRSRPSSVGAPPTARPPSAAPPRPSIDYAALAARHATPDVYTESFGLTYDYSLASIVLLDAFLDELWGEAAQAPGQLDWEPGPTRVHAMVGIAAYVGEVIRRRVGGRWTSPPEHPSDPRAGTVQVGSALHWPFGAVLDRLREGSSHALHPFTTRITPATRADAPAFEAQAASLLARSRLPVETRDALAIRLLEAAVSLDPSSAPRLAPLVARLAAERDAFLADASPPPPIAAPAAAADPVEALLADAAAHARAGRIEPARASLAKAGALASTAAHRLRLALWLHRLGAHDDALASLDLRARHAYAEAVGLAAEAEGPGAGGVLRAVVRMLADPSAAAWEALAQALGADGWHLAAVAAARRAVQSMPGAVRYLVSLGVALLGAGATDEAIALLQRATTMTPSDPDVWLRLGVACLSLERFDDVATAAERASALDPRRTEAWILRATAGEQLGHWDDALGWARRALTLPAPPPLHDEARALVARLETLMGVAPRAEGSPYRGGTPATATGPALVFFDPPHADPVDLEAVAGALGLQLPDARMRVGLAIPTPVALADDERGAERLAAALVSAGVRVASPSLDALLAQPLEEELAELAVDDDHFLFRTAEGPGRFAWRDLRAAFVVAQSSFAVRRNRVEQAALEQAYENVAAARHELAMGRRRSARWLASRARARLEDARGTFTESQVVTLHLVARLEDDDAIHLVLTRGQLSYEGLGARRGAGGQESWDALLAAIAAAAPHVALDRRAERAAPRFPAIPGIGAAFGGKVPSAGWLHGAFLAWKSTR